MLATAADSELDRGPALAGGDRFCALERVAKPTEEMIRFVVGPDSAVVPDVKRKLPGRGIWLTASRAAVDKAVKRRVFSRGFRKELRVAPDLAAMTENLLERAALDALAIAGKAGDVVCGFGKVEETIESGEATALIHASEAAEDGKRKLGAALRRRSGESTREIPLIDAFSGQQLDLALGRVNVIHAALLGGAVSATFLARTRRFLNFRDGICVDPGAGNVDANVEEQLRTE